MQTTWQQTFSQGDVHAASELELKLQRIYDLLDQYSLNALLLRRASSYAWATCGHSTLVNSGASAGVASILITQHGRYILTDNIQAARLQEELQGQEWEFRVTPWHEQSGLVTELTQGMTLGADCDYPAATALVEDMARLRTALAPDEAERLRGLCRATAEAMDAAIMSIRPRLTEQQIDGILCREALGRGIEPTIHLVATDERATKFRQPLATEKRLDRYAVLTLSGRRAGLVASITRAVHFGPIPEELRNKARAVALVDAHFISATRPGKRINEIFHEGTECYRLYGFEDEWQQYHQGGLVGYMPREVIATPRTDIEVRYGQAYAWNPSIAGVRSEDTFLVGQERNDILTAIPRWPVTKVNLRGQTVERPAILEIT